MTQAVNRVDLGEPDAMQEYGALVRSLRRNRGFGLFFVQASPAKGQATLENLRRDLPEKSVVEVMLTRTDDRLFEQLETMWEREKVDIFWIEGLEQSLLGYEDMQRLAGWDEPDLMTYSWKDVPPILSHLNLGRERFQARFDCALVFVVPLFVVKYLLRRAGDFFDWKSGFFEFPDDQQESASQMIENGNSAAYLNMDSAERTQKILQIKDLLDVSEIAIDRRILLLREIGRLFESGQEYEQAIAFYKKVIQIKPYFSEVWNDRGDALNQLGRYEQAIVCYEQAIDLNPLQSMKDEQVWAWVQKELLAMGQSSFDEITIEVFRRAWTQQTYDEMAREMGYSSDHLRALGSELFKRLGRLLGESISKNNFRTRILDRITPSNPEPKQDPRFLGRDREIQALKRLADSGSKIIVIQGLGGAGKTTLACKYFYSQGITTVLEIWMPIEGQVTSAEFWVEEWLRGVFNVEVGADFGINLERLKLLLIERSQPVGIMIDNLETILNGSGQILPAHRRYVELLRMLSNARLPTLTLITSREDLCEIQIDPEIYRLDGLDELSWQAYFDLKGIQYSPATLLQVWTAANGNPKAMKILAGAARSDFEQNLDRYWASANQDILIEGKLQVLIEQQFQRLALTQPDSYQLLCRLGVYRYQDVPNVSLHMVLELLWELPNFQARRALNALKERSLIDSRRNEIFWLHPVIHTESIKQLKAQGNWDSLNRRAGEIWQTSVQSVATIDDALQAMEAYYHFIEIGDYDLACEVILALKETPGGDRIALGWLFYRLGLMRQILSACEILVLRLPSDDRTSQLRNLIERIIK
jgi:tetratricopeptide (TPR) repeat protein